MAELTQHIPPKGVQLIRRYGLSSSRIKGNRDNIPAIAERALPGWKKQHGMSVQVCDVENTDLLPDTDSVELSAYNKAWAQLLSKSPENRTLHLSRMRIGNNSAVNNHETPRDKVHITPSSETGTPSTGD